MAHAIARGSGDPVLCSDHGSGRARALADAFGGEALRSNPARGLAALGRAGVRAAFQDATDAVLDSGSR